VALIDSGERRHPECVAALGQVQGPLLTTWAVVTESMHLLADAGWRAQSLLWQLLLSDDVELVDLDGAALVRAIALMEKYRDLPMDVADATLVAVAEQRRVVRILTLDSDFRVYRTSARRAFEVLPATSR
jgi:predicted nucleic acid-binding protein